MFGMIATGIIAATTLVGAKKQKDAGDDAQALADANARNTAAETEEMIKRTEADQQQTMDLARAMSAGSGIKSGAGSFDTYMTEMQSTFDSDVDWMRKSGASQESIQRAEGSLAKKQSTANAWGTVAQGTSSLLNFWTPKGKLKK